MTTTAMSAKERAARSRLKQILNEPGLLRANWIPMRRPCGGVTCRCSRGKRNWHLSWYVSQSMKGKLRMKCVPRQQWEEVRRWVLLYQEARKLLAAAGDASWDRVVKPSRR